LEAVRSPGSGRGPWKDAMSNEMKLGQRPVPEAALRDKDAVEMLRVWIAEGGLHCSLTSRGM